MGAAIGRITSAAPYRAVAKALGEYGRLRLGDRAAALTYYAVLSIFPGMIVLLSLLGIFGDAGTGDALLRIIEKLAPGSAANTFQKATRDIVTGGGAGLALGIGLAAALYSSSGYIGAFSRAANGIYEVEETRPFWRSLPRQLVLTIFLLTAFATALIALVASGPLAEAIGNEIGIGETALEIFTIAKWPVLLLVVSLLFAVLLYNGPNVEHPSFRWLLPGAFLATVLWLAGSAGFSAYVANFGKYASTYGSLAGVVIFLLWIWLSNLAILIGTAVNVELAGRASDSTSD